MDQVKDLKARVFDLLRERERIEFEVQKLTAEIHRAEQESAEE